MLFRIGEHDYTTKIRQGTYRVNSEELFKSWTDANYNEHRHIYRTRVSGTFTLYFGTQAEYVTFLERLNAVKDINGYYVVGLWSNNIHRFEANAKVFIDSAPVREQKIIGEAWFPELVINVEEI